MTYDNKTTLQTPLIGKVVILNRYILDKKPLPSKTIQRVYVEPMLSLCRVLYLQAMRELRGKDYLKRAIETVSDIQSSAFLVYSLKGWSEKVAAVIDSYCDDIADQLYAIDRGRASIGKSKDEAE